MCTLLEVDVILRAKTQYADVDDVLSILLVYLVAMLDISDQLFCTFL